jgi:hypothetical protein
MVRLWLAVVVIVLSSAAPMHAAWAQCAWVLWAGSQSGQNLATPLEGLWTPSGAFDARGQCDAAASDIRARLKARGEQPGWTTIFVCLPDSIDPRGPKGGGR